METLQAIRTRRSIRGFLKKKVTGTQINKILDSGLLAPSSKNCQPWYFIVLKGKKKDKLVKIVGEHAREPMWTKLATTPLTCNAIKQAPVLILVLNKGPRSGGEQYIKKNVSKLSALIAETLSIGACIENMLLSAHSMGLAALWCGDLRNAKKEVEQYLKTKYDLIAGVAIGYPSYNAPQHKDLKIKQKYSVKQD